jgi:hypothetical protein
MDRYRPQHGYIVRQVALPPIDLEPIPVASQPKKRRERSPDPYFIPLSLIIVLLMSIVGIQLTLFGKSQWDQWEYQDYQNTKMELKSIKQCLSLK